MSYIFGLSLLFCLAWAATSSVKTEVYVWVYLAKIEGPNYLLGASTALSPALLIALALMLWLQRDNIGHALCVLGAVGSRMFCLDNAQIIWWCVRLLRFGGFSPMFLAMAHQNLWTQFFAADAALTLSIASLWFCMRAARPKGARPLAGFRDWKLWSASLPTSKP